MASSSGKTLMGRRGAASARVTQILAQQPRAVESHAAAAVQRAVLFTDIVGSTAYFEQRGDTAGLAMIERHNRLLFPIIDEHRGRLIKTIGDAIMAAFSSPADAVRAAVAMQRRLQQHNAEQPRADHIRVRIGIHYGPVLERDGDLFGDTVNAAARIEALAAGGQVLIAGSVEAEIGPDFPEPRSLFDALQVRGKRTPLEIHEVRWCPQEAAAQDERPRFEPGTVLGDRFEITAQLGEGGMGQVYEARDRALDEVVALKFVRPDLAADSETLQRFKSEVRLARSVSHPNICRIHEFLEMDGRAFLSMERIQGQTLAAAHTAGAMAPERIIALLAGICAGLQAAHERGITHCDLKPANVMIESGSRRVVLMDFGIAQLARQRQSEDAGSLLGTPEYMAPEQVAGEPAGPGADLYALGVILFELLTGKPPFAGSTPVAVALQHLQRPPPDIAAVAPQAPAHLARAVERCLRKRPAERYPDARSLAAAVRGEPAPQPGRRRWAQMLAAATALAGLTLVLVLASADGGPDGPAAVDWRVEPLVSSQPVESMPRYAPEGRALAYLRGREIWLLRPGGGNRRLTTGARALDLPGLAGLSWTADGRSLLWTAHAAAGPEIRRVAVDGGDPQTVLAGAAAADPAPDGRRLAFCFEDEHGHTGIAISRPDGSRREVLLPGEATRAFLQPRWSPDGRRLAVVVHQLGYRTTRDIGVVDVADGRLRLLTEDGAQRHAHNTDPGWTPDGRWIVYASQRNGPMSLWQVPATGGESVPLGRGAIHDRRSPSVAPDGERIAFVTSRTQWDIELIRLDAERGRVLTQDVWLDRFPVFAPDDQAVAYRTERRLAGRSRRAIAIQQLAGHDERVLPGPDGLRDFAWCGSEALVFAATAEDGRQLGRMRTLDGRTEVLLRGFHRLWSPSCSPDGRRVVFVGMQLATDRRDLWLVRLDADEPPQRLSTEGRHDYPEFSPDGRAVAYRWAPDRRRLGQSELRLLQLDSGTVERVTADPVFQRSRRRLRFERDGRWIYFMENDQGRARLWRVARRGTLQPVRRIIGIQTFDFDLSKDAGRLVYSRVLRSGDLYQLQPAGRPRG
jgi:class 3 adenylate cyclase/Tol biopolymer transport system component/predicted Ser/Thr protein kinase